MALANWARKELARQDLIAFAQYIDPNAAESYGAPHMAKMAEKLEAVERGEIKRLFITTPPRHWKSSLACEKFPMYYLGRNPEHTVIATSHSANLALGFSRNVRDNILFNPLYHELFPHVRVNENYSNIADWALLNAYRSTFRALGVGGHPTGRGAKLILIDDPVADDKKAFTKSQREALWVWYLNSLRDRLEPGGAIVLIMSRWDADDLAGRLLKASESGDGEKWETLHLQAIFEPTKEVPVDPLGRQPGEALWPSRWPKEELETIKAGIGGRAFAAKFQGSPRSLEGNILDPNKLVMVDLEDIPTRFVKLVRYWDLAFSDKQGADFVAGVKMGIDNKGKRYIIHLKRIHGRWPVSKPQIIKQAEEDGPLCVCAIEANGTQIGYYQDIKDDPRMFNRIVVADQPEANKEMRASVWGSRLEDGIIHCVRGPWNQILFDEMDSFSPTCEHDDVIDGVSGAWKLLGNCGEASFTKVEVPEHRGKLTIPRRGTLL